MIGNENILLASASNDKTVNIYNISKTDKAVSLVFSYKYHLMGINKVTFNNKNTLLLSGGNDFQLNVLDLNNQSLLRNFRTNSVITSIDINYASNIIAVGTYDNSILLFDLRSRANSGVQVNLSADAIRNSEVVLASKDICRKFSEIVDPLIEKTLDNQIENQCLAALRDTLLPKLMSGEIDVSQVQI